jgi:hypothetical protein
VPVSSSRITHAACWTVSVVPLGVV